MGTTPNLKIVYPDPSAVPSRKSWIEDPMLSVDAKVSAALTALSMRTKSGTVGGNVTANVTAQFPVLFGTAFGTAPAVTVAPATSAPESIQCSVGNISATGFTVYVRRSVTGTVSVRWVATDLGNS